MTTLRPGMLATTPTDDLCRHGARRGPATTAMRRGVLAALSITAVVATTMTLGGCYSRVVAVKGIGVGIDEVYEPNLKDDEPIQTGGFKWSKADPDRRVQDWKAAANPKSKKGAASF